MGLLGEGYSYKEGRTLNPLHNRKVRNDDEKENRENSLNTAEAMAEDAKAIADRDKADADALMKKQIDDANALKKRGTGMQGGGRKGLMSSNGAQGV